MVRVRDVKVWTCIYVLFDDSNSRIPNRLWPALQANFSCKDDNCTSLCTASGITRQYGALLSMSSHDYMHSKNSLKLLW